MNILGPSVKVYRFEPMGEDGFSKQAYEPWPGKLVDSHEHGIPGFTWRGPNPEKDDYTGSFFFQAVDYGNRYVIEFYPGNIEEFALALVRQAHDFRMHNLEHEKYLLQKLVDKQATKLKSQEALLAQFEVRAKGKKTRKGKAKR